MVACSTQYTVSHKTTPYDFLNNSVNNKQTLMIFATQNVEEIWYKHFC